MLKKITLNILFLILTSVCFGQYDEKIKIMTYNIFAKGNSNSDYQEVIDAIQEINPDICALQEVDNKYHSDIDVSKLISEASSMHQTFHTLYQFPSGGKVGDAMLYRSIPKSNYLKKVPANLEVGSGSIIISETIVEMNNSKVAIYNTHLTWEKSEYRVYQVNEILDWINNRNSAETPIILLGDFNSKINSPAVNLLEVAGFDIAKNSNSETPAAIDHIMFKPSDRWVLHEVASPKNFGGSDHYPVWATLELLDLNINTITTFDLFEAKAFPNPFTNNINIEVPIEENGWLSIYNVYGKRVYSQLILDTKFTVSLSKIPSGVYFVKFNNSKTIKLINE